MAYDASNYFIIPTLLSLIWHLMKNYIQPTKMFSMGCEQRVRARARARNRDRDRASEIAWHHLTYFMRIPYALKTCDFKIFASPIMPIIISFELTNGKAQFSAIANKSRHSSIQLCWLFILLFKWNNNDLQRFAMQIMISENAAASGQDFDSKLSYELKFVFKKNRFITSFRHLVNMNSAFH